MLRKTKTYTVVTPIPGFIPRRLALDILHSHSELIKCNPLVLGHKPVPAPHYAAAEDYHSTWYEINQRVQVIPGTGKLGAKYISFHGCFYNTPSGLQTHTYAPFGIEMRIKYRLGGNQPGIEPPEQRDMDFGALGIPTDGLYIREDIEFSCNVSLVSFVKAQLKDASKEMVRRIIDKAELLDAAALQAMMNDGELGLGSVSQLEAGTSSPTGEAPEKPPFAPNAPDDVFNDYPKPLKVHRNWRSDAPVSGRWSPEPVEVVIDMYQYHR